MTLSTVWRAVSGNPVSYNSNICIVNLKQSNSPLDLTSLDGGFLVKDPLLLAISVLSIKYMKSSIQIELSLIHSHVTVFSKGCIIHNSHWNYIALWYKIYLAVLMMHKYKYLRN